MAFPELLKNILPTNDELSNGVRFKDFYCPKRNKKCGDKCVDCPVALEYHKAFSEMGRFGLTQTIRDDNSKQTTLRGIGSFETRNGRITYELNEKIDVSQLISR